MSSRPLSRRLAILAVGAAAASAAAPAPASASDAQCPVSPVSSPFAAWGDNADYKLVADVEDEGASWSLGGGAGAQAGNQTFMVGGASDASSLRLPSGGSATTPQTCIGSEHPSFRFFAKRTGGSPEARLVVEVVYSDAAGAEHAVQAGIVEGSWAWAPSGALPTIVDELAARRGSAVDAAFRFTPQGGGLWSIDDVYVDPHRII